MNPLSIRFMIGLAQSTDRPALFTDKPNWIGYSERAERALAILGQRYDSFSSWRGVGHWKGEREPTLTVEVIVPYLESMPADGFRPSDPLSRDQVTGRAQSVAGEIALALSQQAVAVSFAPVDFLLVSPEGTST